MNKIINALPLYNFMKYCEDSNLEKKVIDCGAGGKLPPLSLFYSFGYEVFGIDNSIEQIEAAERFAQENNMNLNIELSDMRNIPKSDNSYSFCIRIIHQFIYLNLNFVKLFPNFIEFLNLMVWCL